MHVRDQLALDQPSRLNRRDHGCIRKGAHEGRSSAVDSIQLGNRSFFGYVGNGSEGDFLAPRSPNANTGQFAQTATTIRRVPHHDLHFIPTPLNPLNFFPVEARPQLSPNRCGRQSRRNPGRSQFDFKVSLSEKQAVSDPENSRNAVHESFHCISSFGKHLGIVVFQRISDTRRCTKEPSLELDPLEFGNIAQIGAPGALDFGGRDLAKRAVVELYRDIGHVASSGILDCADG